MLPFISVECVEETSLLPGPADSSRGVCLGARCPPFSSLVSNFRCPRSVWLWKGRLSEGVQFFLLTQSLTGCSEFGNQNLRLLSKVFSLLFKTCHRFVQWKLKYWFPDDSLPLAMWLVPHRELHHSVMIRTNVFSWGLFSLSISTELVQCL